MYDEAVEGGGMGATRDHSFIWAGVGTVLGVVGAVYAWPVAVLGVLMIVYGMFPQPIKKILGRVRFGNAAQTHIAELGAVAATGFVDDPVAIGVQEPISESVAKHRAVMRMLRGLLAEGKILVARGGSPVFRSSNEQDIDQWKERVLDELTAIDKQGHRKDAEQFSVSFLNTCCTRPVNLRPVPPGQATATVPARAVIVYYKPRLGRPAMIADLALDMPTAVAKLEAIIGQLEASGPQS